MVKPKSYKKIKSINFDDEVLIALEERCKKQNVEVSTFVNLLVKKVCVSEYEFYRQMAKHYCSEMNKCQLLMNTAVDRPEFKKNDEITIKIGDE
jgi:hypothetical protein